MTNGFLDGLKLLTSVIKSPDNMPVLLVWINSKTHEGYVKYYVMKYEGCVYEKLYCLFATVHITNIHEKY